MNRARGFTVIETVLFLAISGLLVIGIMYGAGAAINIQRYKDAHNSLTNFVQGEYDRVVNVQNNRDEKFVCVPSEVKSSVVSTTPGTSSCVILGRLLQFSANEIKSTPVYATNTPSLGSALTDTEALAAAGLFASAVAESAVTYQPEWGTKLSLDTGGEQMLIVRSPVGGSLRTYVSGAGVTNLSTMITNATYRKDIKICLDPAGLVSFNRYGLKVLKDSSGQAGVKSTGDGEC